VGIDFPISAEFGHGDRRVNQQNVPEALAIHRSGFDEADLFKKAHSFGPGPDGS
jgi:hypothetical protein